ncbi:hypothetical protein, partial [Wolbachia endosymbiont of Protocalliphora sialia]
FFWSSLWGALYEVYKNYNLKDIYRTYKALCRWNVSNMDKWSNNKFKFEALITKLKKQIYIIAKKQKLLESCIDIRFASKIIQDLPELKLKDLIISESEFLIPLMQCLSISVNNSNANVLKDSWSRTDILSGLQILYEIVSKIEDRSGLKEVFDTDLSKIYSKLVKVKVIYANEVLKEVNKLDKLGIIKNGKLLCKSKQFTVDLQVTNEDYDKACDRQIPTSDPSHNAEKKEEDNQLLHELCTKDLSNQKIEASSAVRNILLQDDKMSYTTRRCIGVVGNKLSSLFNFATGYFFQVFPPYEQAKDTGSSQPLKVMEDKIIETVKQIISERVELEKSNINFKQMKKKIVQRFNKGNFDDITKSIALRIFEEGSRDLKAKFKNVKSCKQIVERRINQLIQDILKNRNSMPEVNDVKEQKTSFKPESHLNDTAVQGHITQDKVKLIS